VLVSVALLGFLVTREGRDDARYAAMNPIRDTGLRDRLLAGSLPPDEALRVSTTGSALAAETLYLPPGIVLKAMALGYPQALADLILVRAHSYFLTHFFADRIFAWLDSYYDAVVGLDPDNPRVYQWFGYVAKLGQGLDDDVVRHADRFLEDGLARFPRDSRLHMDLGFNLNFDYKGADDADKAAARLKARDHFTVAAGLPGSSIDPNFLADLYRHDREDGLAAAYALQKYYEATDDQREQLLRRISLLSEELAKGIRDEETRWHAEMPFLDPTLFSLVGGKMPGGLAAAVVRAVRE
jgi:hypothetical protein